MRNGYILMIAAVILTASSRVRSDITVASDGSGQFKTVQSAIDSVPANNSGAVLIRIKPGTYTERIEVPKDKPKLHLIGEDAARTILTFNLVATALGSDGQPLGTFKTPSVTVWAADFTAENLTFANSTPRDVAQALAIAANGDRQVFRHCRFLGWQDTIYTGDGRKYFENCYVEGGVDFIFGPGTAVFKDCEIRSKRAGYLTAASTPQEAPFGYVFFHCRLTADADVPAAKVYLGRPWRDYASVVFLDCEMGPHIRPEGWHNWKQPDREKTARYAEYKSTGPGANAEARVKWSKQLADEQAKAITPEAVLAGREGWNPTMPASP